MLRMSLALILLAPAAIAQTAMSDLDCEATPGGVSCEVPVPDALVYCVAVDEAGEPVANSTVSAGTGVAVFNTEEADRIAAVQCSVE